MSNITVDSSSVEQRASALRAASSNFRRRALGSVDGSTTIAANQNAQSAFKDAQQGRSLFASALGAASAMIVEIRNVFTRVDNQSSAGLAATPKERMRTRL